MYLVYLLSIVFMRFDLKEFKKNVVYLLELFNCVEMYLLIIYIKVNYLN